MICVKNVYKQSFHCLNLTMLHIQTDDTEITPANQRCCSLNHQNQISDSISLPRPNVFTKLQKKYDISDTAINTHCPKLPKILGHLEL